MEAKRTSPQNQPQETKKDTKTLSKKIEQDLQDENLRVYHQLLWAEEQLARNR